MVRTLRMAGMNFFLKSLGICVRARTGRTSFPAEFESLTFWGSSSLWRVHRFPAVSIVEARPTERPKVRSVWRERGKLSWYMMTSRCLRRLCTKSFTSTPGRTSLRCSRIILALPSSIAKFSQHIVEVSTKGQNICSYPLNIIPKPTLIIKINDNGPCSRENYV